MARVSDAPRPAAEPPAQRCVRRALSLRGAPGLALADLVGQRGLHAPATPGEPGHGGAIDDVVFDADQGQRLRRVSLKCCVVAVRVKTTRAAVQSVRTRARRRPLPAGTGIVQLVSAHNPATRRGRGPKASWTA